MNAAELCELAGRFLAGETSLGSDIELELDRDATGHAVALHAWPHTPQPLDPASVQLGRVNELPPLSPRSPRRFRFIADGGIAIIELDAAMRLVAVHAHRLAATSLAGALTTQAQVLALYELVTGDEFTVDAVHRLIGRPLTIDDWRHELQPRIGASITSANLELASGGYNGLRVTFAEPITLDARALETYFGMQPTEQVFGNPPGLRTAIRMRDARGSLSLTSRDRGAFYEAILRRSAPQPPPAAPIVHAPTPVTPFLVAVDAFFERGLDGAAMRDLLGGAARFSGGTVSIPASVDPQTLAPQLGAAWSVSSPLAYAAPLAPEAQRFPVLGAAARGFVLVEPDRISLHREPRDAWLGDFVTADDITRFIDHWIDTPELSVDVAIAMLGVPHDVFEVEGRRIYKLLPFAGSNLAQASLYCDRTTLRMQRIECTLWAPRAIDLEQLTRGPIAPPRPKLSFMTTDHVQFRQQVTTPEYIGVVLLNVEDRRPGPLQLLRGLILDRVLPGATNPYDRA